MFKGLVNIVKRRNVLHCGVKVRIGNSIKLVSICNTTWRLDDEKYKANSEKVTCNKCLKILLKTDENGMVNLRGNKSGC